MGVQDFTLLGEIDLDEILKGPLIYSSFTSECSIEEEENGEGGGRGDKDTSLGLPLRRENDTKNPEINESETTFGRTK